MNKGRSQKRPARPRREKKRGNRRPKSLEDCAARPLLLAPRSRRSVLTRSSDRGEVLALQDCPSQRVERLVDVEVAPS